MDLVDVKAYPHFFMSRIYLCCSTSPPGNPRDKSSPSGPGVGNFSKGSCPGGKGVGQIKISSLWFCKVRAISRAVYTIAEDLKIRTYF